MVTALPTVAVDLMIQSGISPVRIGAVQAVAVAVKTAAAAAVAALQAAAA